MGKVRLSGHGENLAAMQFTHVHCTVNAYDDYKISADSDNHQSSTQISNKDDLGAFHWLSYMRPHVRVLFVTLLTISEPDILPLKNRRDLFRPRTLILT